MPLLYLASASPRRAELLRQIGIDFEVCSVDIDESWPSGEPLAQYVARLAQAKALHAARQLPANTVILAADTAGQCNSKPLVKPVDKADAIQMLKSMSGQAHTVSTAISVCQNTRVETRVISSEVFFRPISAAEIDAYWASGEPQDKAGSYAIQGKGAIFVERLSGSYSAVVGLPLCETAALLADFGVPCWQTAP